MSLHWGTARSTHGGAIRRFVHWIGDVVGESVYHAHDHCWSFQPLPPFKHLFFNLEGKTWTLRSDMAAELTRCLEKARA